MRVLELATQKAIQIALEYCESDEGLALLSKKAEKMAKKQMKKKHNLVTHKEMEVFELVLLVSLYFKRYIWF